MKILIIIGMIIVFISAFFIFFIFDTAVRNNITCMTNPNVECSEGWASTLMVGLVMIGMFIITDIITVYIIFTTAIAKAENP